MFILQHKLNKRRRKRVSEADEGEYRLGNIHTSTQTVVEDKTENGAKSKKKKKLY